MSDTVITTQSQEDALQVVLVNGQTYQNHISEETAQQFGFKAQYKQTFLLPNEHKLLVGIDQETKVKHWDVFHTVNAYHLGAVAVKALEKSKVTQLEVNGVSTVLESTDEDQQRQWLMRFVLGMHQAAWHFDTYLNSESTPKKELSVSVSEADAHLVTHEMAQDIYALNQGVALTRRIIDAPPEDMNPESLQKEIYHELNSYENVDISIFSSRDLDDRGMNGILAVGRGSRWEPMMSHVVISPAKEVKHKVCLVGKGLTYDSGGLDIKYAGLMKGMKMDLGGAATMFGVTKALAELGLEHTEVHWISPFVENMPDGHSYKADDVIVSYSGQTFEIIHSDAEGRVAMSDALTYATLQDPDYIVDAATLTGSAVRSLTEYATGLMSNDQELAMQALQTFEEENEVTIQVPMLEVMREQLKGTISDLRTLAKDLNAGHMSAGLFLSHFVDQNLFRNEDLPITEKKSYPWFHLDIAGSAMNEGKNDILVNGATGQSVRSLVRFIQRNDT